MKVQLREAQVKPTTIRLKPGDVAIVMRKEKDKPLNAHCFYSQLRDSSNQAEEVGIEFNSRNGYNVTQSGIYRVSEWR